MINELVNSILQAEEKSDLIIAQAVDKSTEIIADAESRSAKLTAEAEKQVREESEKLTAENNAKCDCVYAKIVKDGKEKAEQVKQQGLAKSQKISDEIVRCILSGNC